MAGVLFSYSIWTIRYPELAKSVPVSLAQAYFDEATLYCDNSPTSIVIDEAKRLVLLNMLVAHIAALNATINCVEPSPIVGRIASASEGSVSVQTQNDYPPGTPQWYQQTRYGSAFWAATAPYRAFRYVANACSFKRYY